MGIEGLNDSSEKIVGAKQNPDGSLDTSRAMRMMSESEQLNVEEQRISNGLKNLIGEKNMTVRNLCFQNGKELGAIGGRYLNVRLIGQPGDTAETAPMQIEHNTGQDGLRLTSYPIANWDLENLAKKLAQDGLTADQMDEFLNKFN